MKCATCHSLGETVETASANQNGPDLVHAPERLRWDWTKRWILDPAKHDPTTAMFVPGITPTETDAVRAFIWSSAARERATGMGANLD